MDLCLTPLVLMVCAGLLYTWDHEQTRAPAWTRPVYLRTLWTRHYSSSKIFLPTVSVSINATTKRNIIRYNLYTRTHKCMAFRYLRIFISPSVLHVSSISSLWFMHINIFNNSIMYLPPQILSPAKRKHRYKYYIIYMLTIIDTGNTVRTTLSTQFNETYAVFFEGYNTP